MVWWLMKQCFSAMIRPLRLTTPSVECVAVKFSIIVSYLLIITNHRRFKHGVVVNEKVFFSNDKTIIMAYCSIWWVYSCEILHHCELFVNIH